MQNLSERGQKEILILRILHVVHFFTPARGGVAVASCSISKYLAKRGHEVTVVTTDCDFDKGIFSDIGNIEVVPFHCSVNRGGVLIALGMGEHLNRIINSFDIVHVHHFRSFHNAQAILAANSRGVPSVLQPHGSIPLSIGTENFIEISMRYAFDLAVGRRMLRRSSAVLALTKREELQIGKFGVDRERIHTLSTGIDWPSFVNLPKKGNFKEKYGIDTSENIILYLGRLHETKGIDLLLGAFKGVARRFSDARLVLAGPDDGFKRRLVSLTKTYNLEDRVLFAGFIDDRTRIEAYVDAATMVLPKYSGFPATLLEACACGTPIVTTTSGDELDWIDNKVGRVVGCSANEIEEAVVDLLNNPDLRKSFGEEGRRIAEKDFSWSNLVGKLERIYEETIAGEHQDAER